MRCLYVALAFSLLQAVGASAQEPSASKTVGRGTEPGNIVVYKRMAAVDLAKSISFSGSLRGAKLAFQTKGAEDACFVLHDQAGNKDLWPARHVWKLTGNCPHVAGYQWAGGDWAPCFYRMDLFGQDSMLWRRLQEAPQGTEFSLDFSKPHGPKRAVQVRNLVLYRGDDEAPPEAPGGLAAQVADDGVRLSWNPAADNVGVAWYVISRAIEKGPFVKIAQRGETAYTDKPPAAGAYRYRVLAVDYERNVGPWSKEVSIQAGKGFAQPEPSLLVNDSLNYAEHVRAVHGAGAGKVAKGTILFHGDCLHYLDRTRNHIAAIASLLPYGCVNESSQVIKPGNPSPRLVKELERELELRPEFCVISSGLEDLHTNPFPEGAHLTAEDRQKAVDNVLTMVRMCEQRGTVAIVTTLTPFGHDAPKGSPEEKLSDALAKMCEEKKVPVARVFDLFRKAQESGEDYTKLMAGPPRMIPGNPMWPRGYEFDPYTPSFELGITKRIIVVKETIDRVLSLLLDRPDHQAPTAQEAAPAAPAAAAPPPAQARKPTLKKLTEHLWVDAGPINVGIPRDGEKALLIDCGDGAVTGRVEELGVKTVEQIIFTHAHRDQVCGAYALAAAGTKIGVPGVAAAHKEFPSERSLFEHPTACFDRRWVNWCYHPDYLVPAEPLKVDVSYTDGQTSRWGAAEIRALATPGHTDGSMSYVVHADGKCVVFSGDCIYDEGQIWELYNALLRFKRPAGSAPPTPEADRACS